MLAGSVTTATGHFERELFVWAGALLERGGSLGSVSVLHAAMLSVGRRPLPPSWTTVKPWPHTIQWPPCLARCRH